MATAIDQLDDIEQQLSRIRSQVAHLRNELAEAASPAPELPWQPAPTVVASAPVAHSAIGGIALPEPAEARAVDDRPFLDRLGPQAYAWSGGIAMLLGIVFVFVLAVRRGWVDEELRVALGLGVSLALGGVGVWLRRRFGDGPAPVVCAAVAIGGLFTTLVAATRLYGFVPVPAGILLAELIGGLAVMFALRWKTEVIAGLGLVGAMFAAPLVGAGADSAGLALVAIAFAAAAFVSLAQGWRWTLSAALFVVVPQALVAIGDMALTDGSPTVAGLATITIVTLTCLAVGTLWQIRHSGDRAVTSVFVSGSASSLLLGTTAALTIFESGPAQGRALALVALAHLAATAALWLQGKSLTTVLLGSAGLSVGAGAVAVAFDGLWRVGVLGACAVVLAWCAVALAERRLLAGAAAWLGLTAAFAMGDAPLLAYLTTDEVPGVATVGLAILAAAVCAVAWLARRDEARQVGLWAAVTGTLLAVSAGVIALIVANASAAGLEIAFQRAHLAVSLIWATTGLLLLWQGVVRRSSVIRRGASALLIAALVKVFLFDLANLQAMARALSFLAVGAVLLTGAVLVNRATSDEELPEEAAV